MNAAQQLVALLMHGKLQSGGRSYKAQPALMGTPPRKHANALGGLTRGERKRALRALTVSNVYAEQARARRQREARAARMAA